MISHPQIFLLACLSFIFGIFLGSFFHTYFLIYVLIILVFSLIGILWKRKHVFLSVFLILIFCLGFFYVNFKLEKVLNSPLAFNQEMVLKGKIVKNPSDDFEKKKVIFKAKDAKILIFTKEELSYEDEIEVFGKLLKPENFSGFDYRMYLANQGIVGIMKSPEIKIISKNSSFVFNFKNKAEEIILKNLSIKKAGILSAMLLGEKDHLSFDLKQKLGQAGISHITAISGMHVVIISMIILMLLLAFKIERRKSILLMLLILFFYLFLIEFPVSAVRAYIMIFFIFLAELSQREADSLRSLVLAGTLILAFNPLALRYDLGFELSFLAVLGIIYFNNFFKEKLEFIKNDFLKDVISVTLSAQVFTFPLLIYVFKYFSIASFFTNILIVPFLPIILVLGFLSVLFSMFLPLFSSYIFMPIAILLEYVLLVVFNFAFMIIEIESFSLIVFVLIYLVLIFVAFKLRKERFEFYV